MAEQTKVFETETKAKQPRRLSTLASAFGILILLLFIGAAIYLTSPSFQVLVREKVITQLQDATGGRVELKSLRWNLSKLDIEADDLTIHGLEGPNEIPYAHVDHMAVRAKIISLMRKEIGLRYLGLTHPVIHLIVYADGRTNQPKPKTKSSSGPIQSVFDLAIDRAELSNGLLIYNDRKLPFNVAADKVAAGLTFLSNIDPNKREYDVNMKIGNVSTDLRGSPPLISNLETEIALHPADADIKMLRWASPRSRLEASGSVANLKDPQITLSYEGSVNASEAARLLKMPELRGGALELSGKGQYHRSEYAASGKLSLRDFAYRKGTTDLSGVNATTNYAIDPKNVELKNLRAALFGGTAKALVTITDWNDAKRQRGRAHIDLAGISVARVVASEAPAEMKKVSIDSNVSGSVTTEWVGPPSDANVRIALNFAPTGGTGTALPITGLLDAQYNWNRQLLSVAQLDLHTRGTQLAAKGSLGLRERPDASVHITLATQDLGEFTPVLAALKVQKPPLELHGNARFDGTAKGSLALPHFQGHLNVNNFDVLLSNLSAPNQAATSNHAQQNQVAPANSIHWDSLSTDLDYARSAASVSNGMLHRGSATIAFSASARLAEASGRHFVAYSAKQMPFQAKANVQNASLKDIQEIAGYNYPVTGTLQASLNASGTAEHLNGGGNLQISNGSAYGQPFRTLQADLLLAGKNAQVTRLYLSEGGGKVNGTGSYNLTSKAFTGKLNGSGFNLAHFQQLQKGGTHLGGVAQFNAQASGTVDAPSVDAHLLISNLLMNSENIGNVILDAKTQGEIMHLAGSAVNKIAKLNLNGDVRMREDYPAHAQITFSDFDIDPLLKLYMQGKVTGHSRINGQMDAAGPLKKPELLTVHGNIPSVHASVENFNIDNSGPIRFSMADQVMKLEQVHLIGPDSDVTAAGSIALTGARALNAKVDGRVNLKLLQSFDPNVSSSGGIVISASVTGTLAQPNFQGEVDLNNATVSLIDMPNGLSNMNGKLVFTQDRLMVQQLTAQTGGGQLNLGGFVTYRKGVLFDLTATGRDVRVRYSGISIVANADLRYTGTMRGATLGGDVLITRFAMTQQFDLATYIAKSKEPPSTPDPTSVANHIRFNLHISSTPQLAVETSLATLSGDVDLNVRGTVVNPILLGRVNIAEGDVLFQGAKYHLERGDVTFTNALRIAPLLNVEASTTIRDYDITLGFHGPVDRLSTTYRSEPPLSTADIISLLAFQRTTEEAASSQNQTSFTETAQNAVLGEALNAAVSSRIQRLFGISRVKIDPQGGGLENNKPSITIEQSVKSDLTITFVTYPTQSNQQLIQVEYNVNKNISIVGVRDQYGVLGIDVRLRQRRR